MKIKDLEYKIEEILDQDFHKNGKIDSFKIAKEISKFIKDYKKHIKTTFKETRGKQFLIKWTRFYDSIITIIYKTILREMFGNYLPMRNSIPIVIVALGSYGREELNFHSDIDLMVAYIDIPGYNLKEIIEKFIYMAWDSGIKLGHRVHKISEIIKVSKTDFTIKTAMLESRKIIGSQFVWGALETQLNIIRETDVEDFIKYHCTNFQKRYQKFNLGSMEIELKEGAGGLRDANGLFWILNLIYKVNSLKELSGELFSENDFKKFYSAFEFIQQVRTALHFASPRKKDYLALENVPIVAEYLNMSQFQLVQKLLYSFNIVSHFAKINIRKSIKKILPHQQTIPNLRKNRIDKGVYLIDNKLHFSINLNPDLDTFFNILLRLPDINFNLGEVIINLQEKKLPENRILLDIFKRKYTFQIFEILYRNKVFEKLFPIFEKVANMPQFDGYHKHSVGWHSILTLKELENISEPFLKKLFDDLSADEVHILKITTLFHDIGKGRQDDHCKVGAKIIKPFLREQGLEEKKIERISTLIRYHTLMTTLAYNEDIFNEKVLLSLTSKIKTFENLKLLYLLTFADIKSVNQGAFSSYSQKLLQDIYLNSIENFGRNEILKESEKREKIEKQIKNNLLFKELRRTEQKALLNIQSNIAFFKLTTQEIIELTKIAKNLKEDFQFFISNDSFLSIKIIRKSEIDFNIAYFLNRVSFLSVVSLDIFELFNGMKYFQIDFSEVVLDGDLYFIEEIIKQSFAIQQKTFQEISPEIKEDEIFLDCEYSKSYVKFSIHTKNQNGLLAYLFKLFEDYQIDVLSSKTRTFKRKVRDTFLLKREKDCEKYLNLIREMMLKIKNTRI